MMESEKPGWNDAMNGLPGIFGSGVSETVELRRVVELLMNQEDEQVLNIPNEVNDFLNSLELELSKENDELLY